MCSLTFILLSVSPGYHLLLITTFVFSNICDVVCVSRLSVNLDYPSVSLTFMMLSVLPGFVYKRPRLDLFFVVVVVIFLHFFIDSEQDTCKHIQLTNVPSLVIFCWVFLEKMMKILFPIEF